MIPGDILRTTGCANPRKRTLARVQAKLMLLCKWGALAKSVLLRCFRLWGRVLQVELFLSTYCLKALPGTAAGYAFSDSEIQAR